VPANDRNAGLVVTVDLGGTKILICLFDEDGRVADQEWFLTEARRTPETVVESIVKGIGRVLTRSGTSIAALEGVGIAAAGACDTKSGVVVNGPNLGWRSVPITRWMSDALGLPVWLGNDGNMSALGEHLCGAGRGCNNMVYLTVSTGIGGGIIANGELYVGETGMTAEIGHMVIQSTGPLCPCGKRGCLQTLCSGTALVRNMRERLAMGASSLSMFHPLQLLDLVESKPEEITSHIIFEAARRGDALSLSILEDGARSLGRGLTNLVLLLDPQMLVIGGGLAVHWDQYIAPAANELRRATYPKSLEGLMVVPAVLGDKAASMGARAMVRQRSHKR
jgi:glucokinase